MMKPRLKLTGKHQQSEVRKVFKSAVALGFGPENPSASIKALEKEAGIEVKGVAPIKDQLL